MPLLNEGLYEVLELLEEEELYNLAGTVTQGFLRNKLERREEAVDAIFKYSPDERSVLKRKAITKDILFNYLHRKNVKLNLPITKADLVGKIAKLWNLEPANEDVHEVKTHIVPDTPAVDTMAFKFTEWFYSIMNEDACIGPEHFWVDAKLKLNLISKEANVTQEVDSDPNEIVRLLFDTKSEHKLFFNPNLAADGVQGRVDPHGVVIVLSCGTLHVGGICAGVYEQVFSLARDPFSDNNWKIKHTELNLRSGNGTSAQPSLCDNPLTSDLLALPSN